MLLTHRHLRLLRFAGLDALVPRVLECCVARCPAVSEPRTATSAATEFAGFRDSTAYEAHGIDGRRRDLCLHVVNHYQHKKENAQATIKSSEKHSSPPLDL